MHLPFHFSYRLCCNWIVQNTFHLLSDFQKFLAPSYITFPKKILLETVSCPTPVVLSSRSTRNHFFLECWDSSPLFLGVEIIFTTDNSSQSFALQVQFSRLGRPFSKELPYELSSCTSPCLFRSIRRLWHTYCPRRSRSCDTCEKLSEGPGPEPPVSHA